ncbi:efflux RND transporter periplasmic adaptor subunit [Parapedobacter koreensis]|nr:efflux RND transporter periplasmic adaptor subunit [Parapedobacter koreensis]
MKTEKTTAFAFLLALSCGICACIGENGPSAEQDSKTVTADSTRGQEIVELTEAQLQHADIETGKAAQKASSAAITVNGLAVAPPENRHTVGFPMGGYLSSVRLVNGAPVRKGTVMATLEDMAFIQLQEDYLMAKSRLVAAQADYKRQQVLNSTQSASDKVFQQARAEYENQRILVASQGEKLRLIGIDPATLDESHITREVELRSPINGIVSNVLANPGKYTAPEDVLFELVDPSKVYLALSVYEKDARLLKQGQRVSCYANTDPRKRYEATVELINGSINENRAVEVWCSFTSSPAPLMPGTFVTAEIQLSDEAGQTLPEEAVVRWQNKHYVFSAEGERRFAMRAVEIGHTADGYVQIVSGLPENDIVLKNAYSLLMMLKNGEEGG